MSRFRDLLKQHFDDNRISILQFSQKCEIDRTTIQHIIGNRKHYRLPSLEVFDVVINNLPLTPNERKELKDLYTMEKIGIYHYEGRKRVKSIMEQIAWLHNHPDHPPETKTIVSTNAHIVNTNAHYAPGLYKGANTVNSVICTVFAEEINKRNAKTTLQLSVPFSYLYLKQFLLQTCWELDDPFCVKHIVTLSKAPDRHANPNINLNTISDILPFSFCMGNQYQPRYYYSDFDSENELLLAMPYFIVIETKLLLLSNDFLSIVLIDEPSLVQEYHDRFEKSFQQCQSLIAHIADPITIFETYADCMSDECDIHAIESNPCILHQLNQDMIARTVKWEVEGAEKLANTFKKYIKKYSSMHTCNYFTVTGLEQLVRDGRISIFSNALVHPFTKCDRIAILEGICARIQNGGCARLIDSSQFQLSHKAVISTTNNDSLQFYWCENDHYHICMITEASIVASFVDFFESLPQSDFIFSVQKTLEILQDYIDELNAQL